MKQYFHVYTKGLKDDVIFRCDEDYYVGMNYVPVAMHGLDVVVLAFVLMSNHFHFIIYATYSETYRFIENYKNLIGRYARNHHNVKEMLRRVGTGISSISDSGENLKQKIAYVLNNPVAAGINCLPLSYEWGSGRCYFNEMRHQLYVSSLASYSESRQRILLRSHKWLSQDYLITKNEYIDPSCYVDYDFVERLFYRASSLNYYLSQSSKVRSSLLLSDSILINVVSEILDRQYGGLAPLELSMESLIVLVTDLNRRFNSSPKQIARVLKIPLPDVISALRR
jgi:hypothetical protein